MSAVRDPGRDGDLSLAGNTHAKVATDAFGYTLGYFAGDYSPIGTFTTASKSEASTAGSDLLAARSDLWNGNISHMVTCLPKASDYATNQTITPEAFGSAYQYDQLNRLSSSRVFTNINTTTNQWQSGAGTNPSAYATDYTYDAMGNILTQKRNGGGTSATALDELTYNYHTTTDGLVSNRLYQVNDVVSAGNYTDDIDDQGTFNNTHSTIETANNYGYDELGSLVRDAQEEIASIEWTVYGKMKKITRNSGSSKADLEFGYDASGNRLWKKVTPKGSGAVISTYYYLRDAQGNEMCRYVKYTNTNSQLMYVAQEHSIYGSFRVGVDNRKDTLYKAGSYSPAWGGANTSQRALGLKSFELANHLGNVLVTVSDKPVYKVSSATIFFQPEVTSISDYYPFGAPIQGRSFSSAEYRFGFNGQEKDDEIKGSGNSYDFEFRIYDPRLGRFLSIDPLTKQYPMLTPYQFASNRPIDGIDIEGKEWISQHKWSDKITHAAHIKALGSDYVEGMTYQKAWTVMAPKLLEAKEGDTYDCANLSITVMVEYAYTFKLPVYVEDYKAEDKDPTFDNDNYGYKDKAGKKHTFAEGDWKGLADAIAGQYGAADLYNNNKLTTEKSFDNLQAGDLVGWDYPNGNVYHSQTVTEVGDSWLFDFDDKNDYYKTIQGSLSGGQGVPAYEKEYDIGDVKKDGSGSGAKTKALQWNTKNFDKHK